MNTKSKYEWILVVGGILLVLFTIFHIYLSFLIDDTEIFNAQSKDLLQIFNIVCTVIFGFLSYVSLFQRKEMLFTKLGKTICFLTSSIFITRLITEFFFGSTNLIIIFSCLITAVIYLLTLFINRTRDNYEVTL